MIRKTFLTFMILSGIPLGFLSVFYYFHLKKITTNQIHASIDQSLASTRKITQSTIEERISDVKSWSELAEIVISLELNRPESLRVLLNRIRSAHPSFSSISVFRNDGTFFQNDRPMDADSKDKLEKAFVVKQEQGPEQGQRLVRVLSTVEGGELYFVSRIRDPIDLSGLGFIQAKMDWLELNRTLQNFLGKKQTVDPNNSLLMTFVGEGTPLDSASRSYLADNLGRESEFIDQFSSKVGSTMIGSREFFFSCTKNALPVVGGLGLMHCLALNKQLLSDRLSTVKNTVLWGSVALLLVVGLFSFIVTSNLLRPFKEIIGVINGSDVLNENPPIEARSSTSLNDLKEQIVRLINKLVETQKRAQEESKKAAIAKLIRQLVHDMWSPVSVLKQLSRDIGPKLPENLRILHRRAIYRVSDILNALDTEQKEVDRRQIVLLAPLVESIVSEKRVRSRSRLELDISVDLTHAYGLFANIHPGQFQRIISNIIDNSIQAISSAGYIRVSFEKDSTNIVLTVTDDGKGISAENLPKIADENFTTKAAGKGLGLFHAKRTLTGWEGELNWESQLGKGTKVQVVLPHAPAPPWFVEEIVISERTRLVAIDDEPTILQVWKNRFSKFSGLKNFRQFSCSDDFETWYLNLPEDERNNSLYLFDYELIGSPLNGLELIKNYRLQDRSILVTSRFDDSVVLSESDRFGIKLLPKSFATLVSIKLLETKETSPDLVLIDDQILNHQSWGHEARQRNLTLMSIFSPDLKPLDQLERDIPIFVDLHLNWEVSGLMIAKRLNCDGFKRIFISTGDHHFNRPDRCSYLEGVLGKDFPGHLFVNSSSVYSSTQNDSSLISQI